MKPKAVLPQGAEKVSAVRSMFDSIAPRYDLVNRLMTFGLDVGWRRRAVRALRLPTGSLVADLACGTGDFCRELQRAGYRPAGFDLSLGMLRKARTSAPLVQSDAMSLPLGDGSVDGLTCGFALRNVIDIDGFLRECARVMRAEGRLSFLEVATPRSRVLRAGHHAYFHRVVPLIGGMLSDKAAYSYLPKSTAYLPDEEGLRKAFERAGFADVTIRFVGLGAAQIITAVR